jgi:5-methylcytosine-specific restriction endonuclease McrA
MLLAQLEKATFAATDRPHRAQPPARRSRHIAAAVRRAVWARDNGQCSSIGTEGRCRERGFLQFHHLEPHALGGEAAVDRIALRCAAHNRHEAELEFGSCGPPGTRVRVSVGGHGS